VVFANNIAPIRYLIMYMSVKIQRVANKQVLLNIKLCDAKIFKSYITLRHDKPPLKRKLYKLSVFFSLTDYILALSVRQYNDEFCN